MPLPELEAARVKRSLERFAARVPPHARSQLWYTYVARADAVTLVENRPAFDDPAETTQHPFARFKYDRASGKWALWSRDRNLRWHAYPGFDAVAPEVAIAEVEQDPTGIFMG